MTGSHSFSFIVSARYENRPQPANTFGRAYHNPFENHELCEYNNYTARGGHQMIPVLCLNGLRD